MPRRVASLLPLLLVFAVGCTPSVVFLGDPALRAAVGDNEEFESRIREAASEVDERALTVWDPSPELGTAWVESVLSELNPPIAVLSPYFSLFASDLASSAPQTAFIAFASGGASAPNLTRVTFDLAPAMEEAARLIQEWQAVGTGRRVAVLFLSDSQQARAESQFFTEALDESSSAQPELIEFPSEPDRDEVRQQLRNLLAEGFNGFFIRMGGANRHGLDVIQSEPVVFATDSAAGAKSLADALLFSIERPMDAAVRESIRSVKEGSGGVVSVPAEVIIGGGFTDPQLQSSTGPEDDS